MSIVYPWLDSVTTQLTYLRALAVPAKLSPALQALIAAGQLIVDDVDDGVTVSSDDAKQWLSQTQVFSKHLNQQLAAPLAQTAVQGQATPGDGDIFGGLKTASSAAVQTAMSVSGTLLQNLEADLGWIALAVVGALALWALV